MGWTVMSFSYGAVLTSSQMNQMYDNDVVAAPTGKIIAFAGSSAPTGYLACPTVPTNISRTTYAALFAAIGTLWGAGDGSTTFGMPWFPADYTFLQGGTVGSASAGVMPAHTHTVGIESASPVNGAAGAQGENTPNTTINTGSAGSGSTNYAAGHRVLFCVKY